MTALIVEMDSLNLEKHVMTEEQPQEMDVILYARLSHCSLLKAVMTGIQKTGMDALLHLF